MGVFDSGFGGLTVLRELLKHLPGADFVYLGDTAHLPYGSKSQAAVTRFTAAAIRMLVARGAELVVIACNTASALALPTLRDTAPVPLLGVIEPGAEAAAKITPPGSAVLVLATEATVTSHAYAAACAANKLLAIEKACPLFVPLVEEGWTESSITEQIATIYLREALTASTSSLSAVVLGCTHYPLLRPLLERIVQGMLGNVPVVDSAEATAHRAVSLLPKSASAQRGVMQFHFFSTDATAKFQHFAPAFLGQAIPQVVQVDLDI